MFKKLLYAAPEAESLVIQAEGLVCASELFGDPGNSGNDWTNPGLGNDIPGIL